MCLNYYKDFPSAPFPALEDISLRFYIAHLYYKKYFNEYDALMKNAEK